jgi:hypothetical protein
VSLNLQARQPFPSGLSSAAYSTHSQRPCASADCLLHSQLQGFFLKIFTSLGRPCNSQISLRVTFVCMQCSEIAIAPTVCYIFSPRVYLYRISHSNWLVRPICSLMKITTSHSNLQAGEFISVSQRYTRIDRWQHLVHLTLTVNSTCYIQYVRSTGV